MPEYVFLGTARHYPESRDAAGRAVGRARPGDVRDLDGPLDGDWYVPGDVAGHPLLAARDEERAARDEERARAAMAAGAAAEGNAAPAPPGPQPAPPAVIPGA